MNPYLTDDGQRAMAIAGWPEWKGCFGGDRSQLARVEHDDLHAWCERQWDASAGEWFPSDLTTTRQFVHMADHVATALINDHLRKWLRRHKVAVSEAYRDGRWEYAAHDAVTLDRLVDPTTDERQTLIAAVLAVGEKR